MKVYQAIYINYRNKTVLQLLDKAWRNYFRANNKEPEILNISTNLLNYMAIKRQLEDYSYNESNIMHCKINKIKHTDDLFMFE